MWGILKKYFLAVSLSCDALYTLYIYYIIYPQSKYTYIHVLLKVGTIVSNRSMALLGYTIRNPIEILSSVSTTDNWFIFYYTSTPEINYTGCNSQNYAHPGSL